MSLNYLLKLLPFLTGLLEQHVFVSVKVERSNETKYILKIKNNSKRNVEIIKLIADPPTLLKNNAWTSFNDSKFFQNKTLPPGESIDYHFYPKEINDLREMFTFKAEYNVLLLFKRCKLPKITEECCFRPSDYFVTIGISNEQVF